MKMFRRLLLIVALFSSTGAFAQASCYGDFNWVVNGNTVSFISSTGSSVTNVIWFFGDNNYDYTNVAYTQHTYAGQGTYQVCMLYYDSLGSCSDSTCHNIVVGTSGNCNADFTYVDSLGYVFFINNSTPGNSGYYYWDFGDSNTSTQVNPSNVYASPGVYLVCLIALDSLQNFCDSTCQYVAATTSTSSGLNDKTIEISGLGIAPNPANETAEVSFQLTQSGDVNIAVYDIAGREIINLGTQQLSAGKQAVRIDTQTFYPGTYLVRIAANGQVGNIRMLVAHKQ